MGRAITGPRVFRKTASDIQQKAEEYVHTLTDDYTVTLRVNGEDCPFDAFEEKAQVGARVDLEVANDKDPDDKRIECFSIVSGGTARSSDVGGEYANTLKQYNDMLGKFTQTIGDLNRVVLEQNKGQLEMAKTMRKTLKMAAKAFKKSAKDRKKAQEHDGAVGAIGGLLKEVNGVVGPEKTWRLVEMAYDTAKEALGRGKASNGADSGPSKTVPSDAAKGDDSGSDGAESGSDAVSRE